MTNLPLPEPDVRVPFYKETRTLYQGDYYRADKVLPLLKQWAVLYAAAKEGHEQAHAEAVKSAADNKSLREALWKIARTEYHMETPPIESLDEQMRRIARAALKETDK